MIPSHDTRHLAQPFINRGISTLFNVVQDSRDVVHSLALVIQHAIQPGEMSQNSLSQKLRIRSLTGSQELRVLVKDNLVDLESDVDESDELVTSVRTHLRVSEKILELLQNDLATLGRVTWDIGNDVRIDLVLTDLRLDGLSESPIPGIIVDLFSRVDGSGVLAFGFTVVWERFLVSVRRSARAFGARARSELRTNDSQTGTSRKNIHG